MTREGPAKLTRAVLVAGVFSALCCSGGHVPIAAAQSAGKRQASAAAARFEGLLAQLTKRDEELSQELKAIDKELDTIEVRMLARGRAYYRLVRAGLLPIGGGFDGLVDHAAAVERLRAALGRDIDRKRHLQVRKEQASAELDRIKAERVPLEVQRKAMVQAQVAMRQTEERKAAFLRAFGNSSFDAAGASQHRTIYGVEHRGSTGYGVRFGELRGRLALPLSGRTEVVSPREPQLQGTLRLMATSDTPARAVHTGRVAFVGRAHMGGQAVVLDHGERYFSVYANLQRVEVKVGDTVPERARIGWVMRTAQANPWLHFEIRRGKRLLDAARWLGL